MIPKLEVNGVSYSYHSLDGETLALSNISFDVSAGEFVAIVGPSGCGKSTLLTMLSGLTQPEKGTISIDGAPCPKPIPRLAICCRRTIYLNGATFSPTFPLDLKYKNGWTNLPGLNFWI